MITKEHVAAYGLPAELEGKPFEAITLHTIRLLRNRHRREQRALARAATRRAGGRGGPP